MTCEFSRKKYTVEQEADSFAHYLPGSPIFASRFITSNLRNLLLSFASEPLRLENKINELLCQYFPRVTTELMTQWEKAIGLPDTCFIQTEGLDLEERRRHVLLKLKTRIVTVADYIDLARNITPPPGGYEVRMIEPFPFSTGFPLIFPWTFLDASEGPFTVIVEILNEPTTEYFPLEFPWIFGNVFTGIIKCIFEKVKPAHIKFIYRDITL